MTLNKMSDNYERRLNICYVTDKAVISRTYGIYPTSESESESEGKIKN